MIDWNACSAGHPEWFVDDGLHLTGLGAQGHARCLHDAVLRVLDAVRPLQVDLRLPQHPPSTMFRASLRARGGTGPYRFAVRGLPPGLRATRRGEITGAVVRGGSYELRVRVTDATGRTALEQVALRLTSTV